MTFQSSFDLTSPETRELAVPFDRRPAYAGAPKRLLDLVLVLVSLPVSLPLIALLMLLVAVDGGNPLFLQRRIGRHGRIYRIVKLRTMSPGAEALLERHLSGDPSARQEWDSKQKLTSDPRVTRLGRFLRRTSLDELPQLWNVLRGEMSLVGPRPMMTDQAGLYPGRAYYGLRPGITGSWQVSDRHHSDFVERAAHDDAYAASIGLRTDLTILWRTVGAVLRGTGC